MTAEELINILKTMPPEAEVYIHNPDAPIMAHVLSGLVEIELRKHERLNIESHGLLTGDPRIKWDWCKKVVLVSAAHAVASHAETADFLTKKLAGDTFIQLPLDCVCSLRV